MIIIGLTGSIAMGKSTISKLLKSLSIKCYDADIEAKKILLKLENLEKLFPDAFDNNILSLQKLSNIVLNNKKKLTILENEIYPIMSLNIQKIINNPNNVQKIFVLDIPKLFEAGFDKFCDYIITVDTKKFLQKKRIEKRKKYSTKQIDFIIENQMDNKLKIKLSDFKIDTGLGIAYSMKILKNILFEVISNERNRFRYRNNRFRPHKRISQNS